MTSKTPGKTRVAIVGAGFIADLHLQALSELTWVEVVAICDPKRSAAEACGKKWNVRTICSEVKELASLDIAPHVAHVLTPPATHEKLIDELLDLGISVFAEKPLALESKVCERLAKKASDKDLVLGVNHNMCFHPAVVEVLREIEAGTIGKVQFVSSVLNLPLRQLAQRQFGHWMFQEPQNILLETGCHPYSVIHAILGECHDARTRVGEAIELPGNKVFYKSWRTMLDCERGSAISYMSMGREFLSSRVFVIGSDGSLEADLATGGVLVGRKTRFPEFWDIASNELEDAKRKRRNARKAFFDYTLALAKIKPRNDPFYATMKGSVRAFHEDYRDDNPLRMGADEARATLVYCEKIWQGREESASERPSSSPKQGKHKHGKHKHGKKHKATASVPATAAAASEQQTEARFTPPPRERKPKRNERVLLTGGTGFIGSHVVEHLADAGYDVRCVVRNAKYRPEWMKDERVELVAGDASDIASMRDALDGCKHVVHMATAMQDDWSRTKRANVDPTEELAVAALVRGIDRFVFTSTIAALYVGDMTEHDTVRPEHPADPMPERRNHYARGKVLCERILEGLRRDRGLRFINHRPAVVIGPRGRTRAAGAGYWATDNHCMGWGPGLTPVPFVLAGDVAAAIVRSLDVEVAIGKHFNLVGDVRMSAREYVDHLAEISGRPIEFHPQKLGLAQGLDLFKWLVKAAVKKPGNDFPSFRDLKTRALRPTFDTSLAKELLDWQPCADLEHFLEVGIRVPVSEGG